MHFFFFHHIFGSICPLLRSQSPTPASPRSGVLFHRRCTWSSEGQFGWSAGGEQSLLELSHPWRALDTSFNLGFIAIISKYGAKVDNTSRPSSYKTLWLLNVKFGSIADYPEFYTNSASVSLCSHGKL